MQLILRRLNGFQVTREIVELFLEEEHLRYRDNDYVYHLNPNEEIRIDNRVE